MGLELGLVVGRSSAVVLRLRLVSQTLRYVERFCLSISSQRNQTGPTLFSYRGKNKLAKGQNEHMTRMPRNKLVDAPFAFFREREQ